MSENISKKKGVFDILRVTATLLVVMVHLGQHLSLTKGGYLRSVTDLGEYGVQIFFVISGFLIVNSYKKCKSKKDFYIKKVCRILPTYYLIITTCILLHVLIFKDVPVDNTGLGFLRYYLLINTIIPSDNVFWVNLCATWFISAILLFYLLSPFINKIINNYKKSIYALAGSIIFCKLFIFVYNLISVEIDPSSSGSYFPLKYIYNFMFGVAAYYALKEEKKDSFIMFLMILLLIIVFSPLEVIPFIFLIATSITIIVGQKMKFKNTTMKKVFNILSKYSFDVYLGHALALEIIGFMKKSIYLNDLTLILLFLILTTMISWLVHKLSERIIKIFIHN